MRNINVISIVTQLPPAIDGVGDYALNLARQLRQDFNIKTHFIVGNPTWNGTVDIEGFAVSQVTKRSANALIAVLSRDRSSAVLLHYVGYGYANRGCPVWLVEGLQRWKVLSPSQPLVTMFHELYAFGPIWTSQFWTSPLQRNLATRLIRLSDNCLTSKQGYAEIIRKFSQGLHSQIPTLPVFSNIGEPEHVSPLAERSSRLVVFGSHGPRSRVYQRSRLTLERVCRELEIKEIIDIGPKLDFDIESVNGTSVTSLGTRPPEEISKILSTSMVGFFDYHIEFLAKSGIFAAYCAHGVVPIGVSYQGKDTDELTAGKHYWLADKLLEKMNLLEAQVIAYNAHAWYCQHNLSAHASTFANYLSVAF